MFSRTSREIYTEVGDPVEFSETFYGHAFYYSYSSATPLFNVLLSGQAVAIEIYKDNQEVSTYKAMTDDSGNIKYTFVPEEPGSYNVIIIPIYEEGERKVGGLVSKTYHLHATPSKSTIPGFGAIPALCSLVVIALLLRKRKS